MEKLIIEEEKKEALKGAERGFNYNVVPGQFTSLIGKSK